MANPSGERVVIETPPRKRWRLALMGTSLTVLSAGLAAFRPHGDFGLILGVIGLVLFGPITIALLVRALQNRPALVLDTDGFTAHAALISAGFVPWPEVREIEDRAFRRRIFVTIKVTDRAAFLARQSAWHRFLHRINGPMAAGDILISANVLPMRPAELVKTMRQMQRAAQRRTQGKGTGRRS